MNPIIEKLADLIEAHPNCQFNIDNDYWDITNKNGDLIASSNDYPTKVEWYSHGHHYGAALSEAMVVLLNRRGFNIQASAV